MTIYLQEKEACLKKLKEEEQQLDEKLYQLVTERKRVMDALHEYNDIKDATQVVLGRLAELRGLTVAKIHEKFDLMGE